MATVLPRFEIEQPGSIAEASEMLAHFGNEGRAYAGGTELLLAMKQGVLAYRHLVDLKTVPGLDAIERHDTFLRIGALVTHRELQVSPVVGSSLPVLAELESNIANPRVRSCGTIGGNVCFAEPHSDPATLLTCLAAEVEISGPAGSRREPLTEFQRGPFDVDLEEAEILTAIEVPLLRLSQGAAYRKIQATERPALGLAVLVDLDRDGRMVSSTRVTIGSVSPVPFRDADIEEPLRGPIQAVEGRLDEAAERLADGAELMDSLDGDVAQQRRLIRTTLRRAFHDAVANRDRRS